MPTPSLDEFDQLARRGPGLCKVARFAEELSADDRAALETALAESYDHRVFVKWFEARGKKVSDHAIRRHRTRECCCG